MDGVSARYLDALDCARRVHAGQARKVSGGPYVSHLLAVSALVIDDGGTEDEAVAALLHDTVEDHPDRITLGEIRHRFGVEVADIVAACTDRDPDGRATAPSWVQRKAEHLERLPSAPATARRVLAADKLHNVRSLLEERQLGDAQVWLRFNGRLLGTTWYYRQMADLLRRLPPPPPSRLPALLELAVTELESAAEGDLRADGASTRMEPVGWPPTAALATSA